MSLGLDKAMLLISSYSNPVETLEHARSEGVHPQRLHADFHAIWHLQLRAQGKAFPSQ